ncbi:COG3650 family protein [Qipengyuania sphaerica]|uniref:COG3650 family protein n=1 Tax=Qipengyuania sphaerica TaxID=2867243 RepID=UPI001C884F4E|nr:hypothetical protein [Qipengyuania sphaerica]MBX7539588.1 hypothetical protein [Qipengyuania sphaerica]
MKYLLPMACLSLASCQSGDGTPSSGPTPAFDAIAESETVYLTGTEPFWGGEIGQGKALYSTPENQDGIRFPVARFAGNNGLAFTGQMEGRSFDLMVTPGECSDGMSDRTYPYTATLKVGDEQRNGCAWTDLQGFTGPQHP